MKKGHKNGVTKNLWEMGGWSKNRWEVGLVCVGLSKYGGGCQVSPKNRWEIGGCP